MPILTRAEMESRLGESDIALLADRSGAGEDPGAVDAALRDAEAEVMGYVSIATSASVPDPAPDILKRLVTIVARYNLWRREVAEDHPVYIAYRDAVRELREIAAGRIALPFGEEASGTGRAWAPDRVMTDAALKGMGP